MNFSFIKTSLELNPAPQTGLVDTPVTMDGTLRELHIKLRKDFPHSGSNLAFNVYLNGTALFAFPDMFRFTPLVYLVSKTGLNVPVIKGDWLKAVFISTFRGHLAGPGSIVAVIDDGVNYGN